MKLFKILFFLCLVVQLQAQRFNWGIPVKHDQLEFSESSLIQRYLLEENENGLKRLRVEKSDVISSSDVTLEIYNAELKRVKDKVVFDGSPNIRDMKKLIVGDGKFYVFYASLDIVKKTNILYVQTYDTDGEAIGEPVQLNIIKNTKTLSVGEFNVATSENKQHFAVATTPVFEKKTNEKVKVQLFDANFKATFDKEFSINYPFVRNIWNTPFVLNDGTFLMYKTQKVKKVGWTREIFALDKNTNKLNEQPIQLSKGDDFMSKFDNVMLENESGNLVFAGTYKAEGKMQVTKGVCYLEIDQQGKTIKEVKHDFPEATGLGISNLEMKSIELLKNGDLLFVGYDFNRRTGTNSTTTQPSYLYTGKDIYVLKISGEDLVWSQKIERDPIETTGDKGSSLDFVWMYDEEGDNLIVLYNDLQARHQTREINNVYKIPMLAYIAKDGLYSTKPLFNVELGKYGDSYTFCPNEFYQRGNYLIVKCTNNIDFKLGRFSL